jgi:hypothetical protein
MGSGRRFGRTARSTRKTEPGRKPPKTPRRTEPQMDTDEHRSQAAGREGRRDGADAPGRYAAPLDRIRPLVSLRAPSGRLRSRSRRPGSQTLILLLLMDTDERRIDTDHGSANSSVSIHSPYLYPSFSSSSGSWPRRPGERGRGDRTGGRSLTDGQHGRA